jgi:hypothetical protein
MVSRAIPQFELEQNGKLRPCFSLSISMLVDREQGRTGIPIHTEGLKRWDGRSRAATGQGIETFPPGAIEIDFHWSERGVERIPYYEKMGEVYDAALNALKSAQENGTSYIIFTMGRAPRA